LHTQINILKTSASLEYSLKEFMDARTSLVHDGEGRVAEDLWLRSFFR
jgi:hypothetical protein